LFLILTLGALSLALALILTPLVRDSIGGLGFLDHPDGVRKKHASPVPRVGGIAIVIAYVATFAIALALPFTYTFVLHKALGNILALTLVGSIVFLTGVLDDLIGLSAWQKLIGIGGASVLAYFAGIRVDIHLIDGLPSWPWLSFAITVVWLVGCTNAFNLIDGMDGLAAGVGLVSAVTMLLAALTQNNLPLAMATMPLAGCLLGFLRYNFGSASVFLGDSGSLLIGFLLGCYGAFWSEKSVTLVALTVPLLAVSIPLLDVLISISRRFLRNRPIFQADRGHIHHRLLDLGFTPKRAVLIMYGVCSVVAMLSLLVSALHNRFSGLIVILFCGAAWIGVRHLQYAEFTMAGKMFLGGKFRRIIDAEARLKDFEIALAKANGIVECWNTICACSTDFGFRGVRMSLNGKVFEDLGPRANGRLWQIRIPLADAHYINFFRDFDAEMNPVILSAFVNSVEQVLQGRIAQHEQEVMRMPAGSAAFYYAADASAAASPQRN
jgi:UDP-GlcNAc:undecaprenyl-phosphate GlcNAc-1-phosphate transferase